MCFFWAKMYGNNFSFRSVQLADSAEIWVRLMPGISCAGEGRTVLIKALLHRTRILDAFSYRNLIEAAAVFFW
jgi:hypothetical protein